MRKFNLYFIYSINIIRNSYYQNRIFCHAILSNAILSNAILKLLWLIRKNSDFV